MEELRIGAADDPPSLLVALFDADIASWIKCQGDDGGDDASGRISQASEAIHSAMTQLLVFLNAFLLIHGENRVVVLVFSREGSRVAYPNLVDPARATQSTAEAEDDFFDASSAASSDHEKVLSDLRNGVMRAVADSLSAQATMANPARPCRVSASLATALCIVNRRRILKIDRPDVPEDMKQKAASAQSRASALRVLTASKKSTLGGHARILNILASKDVPEQYVPVMNCIFSAQRMGVCIDTCLLNTEGDSTYFQQGAYLTGGTYLRPPGFSPHNASPLLQTLMVVFLVDSISRDIVSMPLQDEVDFRATCFSTRNTIQEGYTCSVCLSTFDVSVGKKAFSCPTCQARFSSVIGNPRPPTGRRALPSLKR